jgi:magnesium and cobalt transporter
MTSDTSVPNSSRINVKKLLSQLRKLFKKSDNDTLESCDYENLDIFRRDMIRGVLKLPELNARDIMKKFQLKKIMHEPYFVPETMPLDELLLEFKFRKLHIAVVVDEYGGVSGIVTLEDILEEIVGDINDEFDAVELPEIEKTGKNVYEVDPRMPIADFNEKLGLRFHQEGIDTIGGYVLDLFGKIPEKGEVIKDGDVSFTIKDISGTVINRITVSITDHK